VLVVARLAETFATSHKAIVEFAVAGALLHDIADVRMDRDVPGHEQISLDMARELLIECGYTDDETRTIVSDIIEPHSCNDDNMPELLEAKVVASADAAAHFITDFYPYFCWMHYGPEDNLEIFKAWVLKKIEKDFNKKIFFDDVRADVRPHYEATKLLFSM
jgi:hypothetical protein